MRAHLVFFLDGIATINAYLKQAIYGTFVYKERKIDAKQRDQ